MSSQLLSGEHDQPLCLAQDSPVSKATFLHRRGMQTGVSQLSDLEVRGEIHRR